MRHVKLYAREFARTAWSMPRDRLDFEVEQLLRHVVAIAIGATDEDFVAATDLGAELPPEPDPSGPHAYALMDDVEKLRRDCAFEARRADEWARRAAERDALVEDALDRLGEWQAKAREFEAQLAQTQAELRRAQAELARTDAQLRRASRG